MYAYLKFRYKDSVKILIKTKNDKFQEEQFHTAGFNSYIAGICFLYMLHGDKTGKILEACKNKIFVVNSQYKSMDLNEKADEYINVVNPKENI